MRHLSENFIACLKSGFLSGIVQAVIDDKDLDFQIRQDYFNIYYKGNSLLKLSERANQHYTVEIHPKFLSGLDIPNVISDQKTAEAFVTHIPHLKNNIIKYGKSSLEIEYEQLLVRANNQESRNNSEYFIIDRQYACPAGRFDLTGIFWERSGRCKGQEVPFCLMEVKFALNKDIREVHHQLEKYYEALAQDAPSIAEENEIIFRQKLDLGLFNQPANRTEVMKTLNISRNISQFQFVLILIDFNPNSSLLELDKLARLSFAGQIRVFHTGFAMWQQNVPVLTDGL